MGKPHSAYWLAIKNVYPEIDPKRTLMIGDKLNTDIAFGNRNGLGFTLLVETGVDSVANAKAAAADKNSHHLVPKYYLKSLNDLNSLFPH
jgi:ribonucleotide monophosphatase NagD (HAD superfamily)